MILSALCEYYDLLSKVEGSGISPIGYQKVSANYVAVIDEDGELKDIISLKELNEGRPQSVITPLSMKKSAIAASPVCDNSEYIFGIKSKKGSKELSEKKFEAAKTLHMDMFKDANSKEAKAVYRFFEKWDIESAWQNGHIIKHYSEKGDSFTGNILFRLEGSRIYFHDVPEIADIWKKYIEIEKEDKNSYESQCSVTGKIEPISNVHRKLSGIKDASTMGASLVCFKKDSDQSYGLKQSINSAVGETAAFKYSTVLQMMLSNPDQKLFIGDATTVFWAEKAESDYNDIFKTMLDSPEESEDESEAEDRQIRETVKSILKDGIKGVYNNALLEKDANFYVLGLSPNAGRTSVRFFYNSTFFTFCDKIKQHYDDISIYGGSKGREYIKTWSLLHATANSKSNDKKVNPLLGGAVTRAILTGSQYPRILLDQTIIRIKAETEITQPRVAIIKGFIVRKNRLSNKEEEIGMSLNEKTTNSAYVLGRTFSILEMIQKNALGDGINATIKDKYFASACSNPALVFPNLLKLAQHHLAKIEGNYWNIKLAECLSLLESESFPKTLNMENQGRFILGYYQQNQKNYEKREKESI